MSIEVERGKITRHVDVTLITCAGCKRHSGISAKRVTWCETVGQFRDADTLRECPHFTPRAAG